MRQALWGHDYQYHFKDKVARLRNPPPFLKINLIISTSFFLFCTLCPHLLGMSDSSSLERRESTSYEKGMTLGSVPVVQVGSRGTKIHIVKRMQIIMKNAKVTPTSGSYYTFTITKDYKLQSKALLSQ